MKSVAYLTKRCAEFVDTRCFGLVCERFLQMAASAS